MPSGDEEPSRTLGVPRVRPAERGRETQRVLGFPQDILAGVDVDFFRGLLHPVKSYRRWSRRRRLGAYAVDEDPPKRNR
jgi:hypothetical protein